MRILRLTFSGILATCLLSGIVSHADAQELILPAAGRAAIETGQRGFPSSRLYWEGAQMAGLSPRTLRVQAAPPTRFTSLAVGWSVESGDPPAGAFLFSIRSRTSSGGWSAPVLTEGETAPGENPSGFYWSNLFMTPGGASNDEFDIVMTLPPGIRLATLQVMAAEILPTPADREIGSGVVPRVAGVAGVSRPVIIPRSEWWGNLPPDSLDGHFGPIRITISHAVVHHTAMTNNPPSPPQEIRSIWNLHVNVNKWSDIGYNFLIDQFGNIYQGRYNPWLDSTDVQGAHATSANVKSVGVSVLGNFALSAGGIPDQRALRSLESLIAWRFDQRGLNPIDSASIPTNLGGPRVVTRICGHRDVGATECPGDNLYVLLPAVRTNVRALLTGMAADGREEPGGFALDQNYPNPFNPVTNIQFSIANRQLAIVKVVDMLGREVATLVNEVREPGTYTVRFDGSGLSSGVYLYRLQAGDFVRTRRLVIVR